MVTTRCIGRREQGRSGFTLIELLTVIAIISLLISILLPSLSRAREQAKNTRTRATLKALGDSLELFKNELSSEVKGEGYPRSTYRDDPALNGRNNYIYGAQWLVRYLLGKDLRGYVAFKDVPASYKQGGRNFGGEGWEQKGWYEDPNIPRSGPFIDPGGIKLVKPRELPGFDTVQPPPDPNAADQPVVVDAFDLPILYYAANTRLAGRANARSAVVHYDPNDRGNDEVKYPGIYVQSDNALFPGACSKNACYGGPGWDFGAGDQTGSGDYHLIKFFGEFRENNPNKDPNEMADPKNRHTFCYYITSRSAYEATKTVVPYRSDSFLLISAGKDAVFGTQDDVTNFER